MSAQVFKLPEALRINGLADVKDLMTPLVESGEDLALDASEVGSLDTSGLQLIIAAHLSLAKAGKRLTIVNPSEALSKAIEVSGAEGLMHVT